MTNPAPRTQTFFFVIVVVISVTGLVMSFKIVVTLVLKDYTGQGSKETFINCDLLFK